MFDVGSGESEECRGVGRMGRGEWENGTGKSTRKAHPVSPASLVSGGKGEKGSRSGRKALTKHCHFDAGLQCLL